ncbi:MAG: HD domain-containing protein [Fimbriimonadaceae bacterium]
MTSAIQEAIDTALSQKAELFNQLGVTPQGWLWCQKLSAVYDELWRVLWRETRIEFGNIPPLAIVATGGYGRQEMSPHSDVDVAFIPSTETAELNQAIRWLFRIAHDSFGKKLGVRLSYVYRPISDLPGLDSIDLSNLLDARHVAGAPAPFHNLEIAMWEAFPTSDFLHAKLQERKTECAKTHETPLVTQPNLKFGAGGLRDFHCSNWIGIAIGERPNPITQEVDFLLKIRNLLHLTAGKLQDDLNFARREELAGILSTTAFELGTSVCDTLSKNHEAFIQGLSRLTESRYSLGIHATAARGEIRINANAPAGIAAVMLADAKRIGLELPTDLPYLDPTIGPEIILALTSGEQTLRALERTGIFNAVLPELSLCKCLMPHDASHQFTVYEHTLRALKEFEEIQLGNPLYSIKLSLSDPSATILAILFHDLGKADSSAPHSETGAKITRNLADRFSLEETLARNVEWLVLEHLTMSQYIRMRDIDHPDTIAEFATHVDDLELLKALTILTYCDVKSVGPELWTPVQETYLLTLFERAAHVLENQFTSEQSEQDALKRVLTTAKSSDNVPTRDLEEFLAVMPAHYLLSTPEESILHHNELFSAIESDTVIVEYHDFRDLGLTEITIALNDRAGVLSDILGVLYAYNLSIQNLRCSTSESDPAIAIDTFLVSKSGSQIPHQLRSQLETDLKRVLLQEIHRDELMRKRGKDPDRRQQFLTLEIIDREPMIIEIRAPRGRGLAYRLSRAISAQGLSILSARLGQWAGSASAGFYVIDPSGKKIDPEQLRLNFFQSVD